MFVNYVTRDDLELPRQTQEFDGISWEEIEVMIHNLDGERHTYLVMFPSRGDAAEFCFGIRSPKKGIYVCNFYDGDEFFLTNPNGVDFPKTLNIGEFAFDSSTEFTEIEDTIKAAKTYFEKGIMNQSLNWEEV